MCEFQVKYKILKNNEILKQYFGNVHNNIFFLKENAEGWVPAAYLESLNRKSSKLLSEN